MELPFEEFNDAQAFEAALSFVEEFSFDEPTAEGLSISQLVSAPSQIQDDTMSSSMVGLNPASELQTIGNTPEEHVTSREEKSRRQKEINERRRLLRKTGVYGNSNRVRNERTREIAVLREQMERLQLDLKVLQNQQTQKQKQRVKKNTALIAMSTTSSTSVPSIWREQAVRQRRRREEAERDNVRLKLAVERQRNMANSLQVLMQKRARQLTNECASLVNTCCSNQNAVDVLDFCGDIGDFRDLFCRLDSAYREIDTVFAANGLTAMTISPDNVHVNEGVKDKYLDFSTYKDLPFNLHDTAEVAWCHFTSVEKHMGNGSLYQKAAKNLDEPYTIIEDFSKEVYSDNSRADVRIKQVVRRYLEPDRDIVIWVSHATPVEVKHKLLRGLTYNLRGYSVTRRSPLSTPGNELTQLQLCSLISLDQEEEIKYGADNVRGLTNFLIVHAAKNILTHRERIENTLADRALRQIEA